MFTHTVFSSGLHTPDTTVSPQIGQQDTSRAHARTAFGGTSTRVTQLWGPCGPLLLCSLYPTMRIGTVYHRNVQLPGGHVKLTLRYRTYRKSVTSTCTRGI